MKRILKHQCFWSLILVLCLTLPSSAQETRFAHINSADLVEMMPGVKAADRELQEYAQQLEQQNRSMMQEYQSKAQDFQDKEALMADAVRETRMQELSDLEMRIQTFQQSAQEKLMNKREELYAPILDRAERAVQDVASEKGYDYVFDTSTGAFIHVRESDNIMPAVKRKLNLE